MVLCIIETVITLETRTYYSVKIDLTFFALYNYEETTYFIHWCIDICMTQYRGKMTKRCVGFERHIT